MAVLPQTPTVLIVDDDRGLVRLLEKAVRREGCATAAAFSGEEALAWIRGHPVDLMLLDLKLPDMTGAELGRRLQSMGRPVPFVVITGQADARLAVEMMKQGAIDYLVKDIQFLDFVPAVVTRALAQIASENRVAAAETERRRLEAEILEISSREQQRIGQDLHDGLGQVLVGISILARTLEMALSRDSLTEARQTAATISAYAQQAAAQTRLLARGLAHVAIERGGLVSALRELAGDTRMLSNVECEFHCDEPLPSLLEDAPLATHLYRIAQEAIANAIKHGHAQKIVVHLTSANGSTALCIRDDGTGMPANFSGGKGMGLHTMDYRARIIGATFSIGPAGTKGVQVSCRIDQPAGAEQA